MKTVIRITLFSILTVIVNQVDVTNWMCRIKVISLNYSWKIRGHLSSSMKMFSFSLDTCRIPWKFTLLIFQSLKLTMQPFYCSDSFAPLCHEDAKGRKIGVSEISPQPSLFLTYTLLTICLRFSNPWVFFPSWLPFKLFHTKVLINQLFWLLIFCLITKMRALLGYT